MDNPSLTYYIWGSARVSWHFWDIFINHVATCITTDLPQVSKRVQCKLCQGYHTWLRLCNIRVVHAPSLLFKNAFVWYVRRATCRDEQNKHSIRWCHTRELKYNPFSFMSSSRNFNKRADCVFRVGWNVSTAKVIKKCHIEKASNLGFCFPLTGTWVGELITASGRCQHTEPKQLFPK